MSVLEDLKAARDRFQNLGGKGMQAAHTLACHRSPTALESLVALRNALPNGYSDFKQFENSPHWRKKEAYAVFDRAIKGAS